MDDIIVLKCGGSSIDSLTDSFYENIVKLKQSGLKPIIVHGGGPAIEIALNKMEIKGEFINGLRKTTAEVMDVVEMVLTGTVNSQLVRRLTEFGIQAVGLSGTDSDLLVASPRDIDELGYVGDVDEVNTSLLCQLLNIGVVPVIAPIGIGRDGTRYNINADTVAGSVAKSLEAKQLVFVTDVPGIIQKNELIDSITEEEIMELISKGTIYGGMIPKVKAALASLGDNLKEAMIIDGNQSVIDSQDTELVGTVIKKSVGVVS
ncbi:MAG TPA: acetylglutamate kinase [Bacillota bacterium]|nr:acetylglutamate kinase [Bacillota bacterium]